MSSILEICRLYNCQKHLVLQLYFYLFFYWLSFLLVIFNNTLCENTSETRTAYQKNVREKMNLPCIFFMSTQKCKQFVCWAIHLECWLKKKKKKQQQKHKTKKKSTVTLGRMPLISICPNFPHKNMITYSQLN